MESGLEVIFALLLQWWQVNTCSEASYWSMGTMGLLLPFPSDLTHAALKAHHYSGI
jgi:hypothetical protein